VGRKLNLTGKKIACGIAKLMILKCCGLRFYGTIKQHWSNATTRSGVTELPMSWVYGVGDITSIAMGLMILGKLVRLAKGEFNEADLIQVTDSEEDAKPHMQEVAK
jgi:hypothetical protein